MSHTQEPASASSRHGESRDDSSSRRIALVVHTIADVAAGLLVLWILLSLLGANQGNVFVQFVRDMADWLSGWSQDIFTMENDNVRFALNYGLPAVVYLFIGHGVAGKIRHQ